MANSFFNLASQKDLVARLTGCPCGLQHGCSHPALKCQGGGKKGIFILTGPADERTSRNGDWMCAMGMQKLQAQLDLCDIDIRNDCWLVGTIGCACDRVATVKQVAACHARVHTMIRERQPRLIIALGMDAVNALYADEWAGGLGGIRTWRGWTIPDHARQAWVVPTWGTDEIAQASAIAQERSTKTGSRSARQDDSEAHLDDSGALYGVQGTVWTADLQRAVDQLDVSLPQAPPVPAQAVILPAPKETVRLLDAWTAKPDATPVALDFETTGLKPDFPDHRIVSCAVAEGPDQAFAFMCDNEAVLDALTRFLASRRRKIAANMKFEWAWAFVCLDVEIENFIHDTVLAAHVLDNRPDICSVKYQAFVRLGIPNWGSEVAEYLKSAKQGANEMNRVLELSRKRPRTLLTYNGMDALVEWRLAVLQRREMELR